MNSIIVYLQFKFINIIQLFKNKIRKKNRGNKIKHKIRKDKQNVRKI